LRKEKKAGADVSFTSYMGCVGKDAY